MHRKTGATLRMSNVEYLASNPIFLMAGGKHQMNIYTLTCGSQNVDKPMANIQCTCFPSSISAWLHWRSKEARSFRYQRGIESYDMRSISVYQWNSIRSKVWTKHFTCELRTSVGSRKFSILITTFYSNYAHSILSIENMKLIDW